MELNREQIEKVVKELRNHGLANGGTLGYHAGWCDEVADILENALALINSQEQRIKELVEAKTHLEYTIDGIMLSVDKWLDGKELEQDEVNRAITMREKTLQIIERLTEENERLRKNNLVFAHGVEKVAANYYNLGCTDTVRKMQERLKAELNDCCRYISGNREYFIVGEALIDQIAKEMLGGG